MNQRTSKPRRLLAVLLALAMMLSILPMAAFAASPVYTRITDPAQLTSGQSVRFWCAVSSTPL